MNLIGRGPSYPYNRSSSGGLSYSEELERINHSLYLIFSTPKGSRLMMPEFGSDLPKYQFDPLDSVLLERIRYTINQDINKWEPRISLLSVEFTYNEATIDDSTLYIVINYRLINSAVVYNYVYPFKLGTYDTLDSSYR